MDDEALIKETVAQDSRYKNIFANLWQAAEELGWRGNLKEVVDFFRQQTENEFAEMRAAWKTATGQPMSREVEQLVFEAPKIKASVIVNEKMLEFIEHIYKANEIAVLFGLEGVAPLAISKKVRGWSKGGKNKAADQKSDVDKLCKEALEKYAEIKQRSPHLSNNAIDRRVADWLGISKSRVYQIRTQPSSKK